MENYVFLTIRKYRHLNFEFLCSGQYLKLNISVVFNLTLTGPVEKLAVD